MTDPVADIARAAAQQLTPAYSSQLTPQVESALYARDSDAHPDRYFDPISLGALIVSIAALAWQVYTDRKKETAKPTASVVARDIRIQLDTHTGQVDPATRDQIIDVVVEETLRTGRT